MTNNKKKQIEEDIRKLVIERIKASSGDLGISIGSKTYSKGKLIKSVKLGDELGQEIINAQMKYLKDLAAGKIYQGE